MIENEYPALFQFFGCYFHQDWQDEFGAPDVAVETYLTNESSGSKNLAGKELNEIISLNFNENELRNLLNQLGCYYDPSTDGAALPDWLNNIRKRINEAGY